MKYRVILTEQTVFEIEAGSPEVALSVAIGEGRSEGDILSRRVDQALPEIELMEERTA